MPDESESEMPHESESEIPHESESEMPVETDNTDIYYVYPKKAPLNEADPFTCSQATAFAAKDDGIEDYTIYKLGSHNRVREENTDEDPRPYMEDLEDDEIGDYLMFNFSIALTTPQVAEFKSILNECVSRESWSGNILTKMESR